MLGIGFAGELGYTIVIPALVFGFGGGFLDKKLGSSHIFLFIGLFIAFVSSFMVIFRRIKDILSRMPKVLPKKKKQLVTPEVAAVQEAVHDLFRPPTE